MWPLLVYGAAVVLIVAAMIGMSAMLGQRHRDRATGEPYEGGILPAGSAELRFSAQFYLVAMFFVIFDLEAVFLIAWAIGFKAAGWSGFIGAAVFTAILVAVLLYEWRIGALDFGRSGKKLLKIHRQINQPQKVLE